MPAIKPKYGAPSGFPIKPPAFSEHTINDIARFMGRQPGEELIVRLQWIVGHFQAIERAREELPTNGEVRAMLHEIRTRSRALWELTMKVDGITRQYLGLQDMSCLEDVKDGSGRLVRAAHIALAQHQGNREGGRVKPSLVRIRQAMKAALQVELKAESLTPSQVSGCVDTILN